MVRVRMSLVCIGLSVATFLAAAPAQAFTPRRDDNTVPSAQSLSSDAMRQASESSRAAGRWAVKGRMDLACQYATEAVQYADQVSDLGYRQIQAHYQKMANQYCAAAASGGSAGK